jgi:hypothetical protein
MLLEGVKKITGQPLFKLQCTANNKLCVEKWETV